MVNFVVNFFSFPNLTQPNVSAHFRVAVPGRVYVRNYKLMFAAKAAILNGKA